jgi:hypothetical protein
VLATKSGGRIFGIMPINRSNLIRDYYLEVAAPKDSNNNWAWEIRRKSKPLGVRIYGDSFMSENAAKLAGEKALHDLLNRIFHELD